MLTNLDWLEKGQVFPPTDADTMNRLKMTEINRKLFEGEQAEIFQRELQNIDRRIANFRKVIDYPVVLNYHKLVSTKITDMLFQEPPIIEINQDGVEDAIEVSSESISETASMACIDASRFGTGVFNVYKDGDTVKAGVTPEGYWFPIVDESNIQKFVQHVIAYMKCINPAEKLKTKKQYQLYVQIHEKGSYKSRIYKLNKKYGVDVFIIGDLIENETTEKTGFKDFAIIPVFNMRTSDRVTGIDDYSDISTIIYEIMVRLSQISKILDKHAEPSMSGPASALKYDEATGEWRVVTGNYFSRESKEDPDVGYVTWDGKIESAFKEIDLLFKQLYIIGELSPALLGDNTEIGAATSGAALRFRMISPLAKAKRLKRSFDTSLKRVIAMMQGCDVSAVSITWQDGLPNDPKEDAETMNKRTGGKATMSVQRALMTYDGLDKEAAQKEQDRIAEDDMSSMEPSTFPVTGPGEGDTV